MLDLLYNMKRNKEINKAFCLIIYLAKKKQVGRRKIKDNNERIEEGQLRTPNPNNRTPARLHSS